MLDEYIDWDIDEEKEKNKKNAEKILKEFSDVEDLREVLDGVQSLIDSEIYDKVYEASNLGEEIGNFSAPSVEYLLERYRQDRYASSVLKNPTLNLFTDNIIFSHYLATWGTIGFVNYVYKGSKLSLNDLDLQHTVLERLMSLLDDFDKPVNFQPPDEDFYKKLKDIEWDKQGKKLYKKILVIIRDITLVRWGTKSSTFGNGEHRLLTFLAACNAINQGKDKILAEDVVVAHKAHLKLLNTDISKLM
ncbi:hypothetical protein [Methanobacterium sp. MBAC-LM]|uniref:hypothetical protein n=1 Tax=Methanobacterium sp. MBAC-LM TaxID=3412034 RepID=UPI003C70C452